MYLSNQSLLVIIVVGVIAGWLAGKVVEGGGFGLIWDLIIGLIGAFIGDWLLPQLGIHLGAGIVALIINVFIGAVVLLLILRLAMAGEARGGGDGKKRPDALAQTDPPARTPRIWAGSEPPGDSTMLATLRLSTR
jgi:uncharacterized membrane protein YeaQ/YmgE (transglycosylase-associated protein family)